MSKAYQYHEDEKAKGNFERGMKALFKAPKTVRVGAPAKGKKTPRKPDRPCGKSSLSYFTAQLADNSKDIVT